MAKQDLGGRENAGEKKNILGGDATRCRVSRLRKMYMGKTSLSKAHTLIEMD